MDALEQLGLIAEIAATYSGFIAVFLAFSGGDGRFSPADGNFVQAMILSSLSAVVFALAPRIGSLLLPPDLLWTSCSWFAISLLVGGFTYQAWWQFRLPDDVSAQLHFFWHIPGWTLAALCLVSFVASTFQTVKTPGFYVLGTSLLLGLGVWSFMAIVFRRFI